MKDQNNTLTPRFFVFIALGLGVLLSVFSIASGNNPIVSPDLKTYSEKLIQNQVPGDQLAEWLIEGKRDFLVVGFRSQSACKDQRKVTKVLKCYDVIKLESSQWIRKQFKNLRMPMIVYGNETEDGIQAASLLAYHGYKTRVLNGGFNQFEKEFLQPEFADIDTVDATDAQIKQLAVYRYFTGDDPIVKTPGQKWTIVMADSDNEEEEEGGEEGDEDYDDNEEEEEEEEEGC